MGDAPSSQYQWRSEGRALCYHTRQDIFCINGVLKKGLYAVMEPKLLQNLQGIAMVVVS